MDHSDRIKQNLEILGPESLEDLSLGELFTAIGKNIPSDVSKSRILNIYAMWLHSRLVVIDVSYGPAFADEIESWYQFLKVLTNDDSLIAGAFRDWQRGELLENPTSSRRLSIAEAELFSLMSSSPTEPESSPTCPDSPYGQRHPDRVWESQDSRTFVGLDAHYGHMHPDRVERSQNPHTVIEIEDDEPEVVVLSSSHTWPKDLSTPQSYCQDGQPDLSFLTGANMLALSDMVRSPRDGQDLGTPSPAPMDMSVQVPLESRLEGSKRAKTGNPKKPPKGYICDRCGVKGEVNSLTIQIVLRLTVVGHDIKECPTNLDPSFDRKPPANYKCKFCDKTGRHYGPLCPKHPDPNAIAHQRRKAYFKHSKARLNNGERGRRNAQSSRSIRDTSEELSRLRLTPVWDRPVKRKASRSPSPDRLVPQKKSKPPIGDGKKKTVQTVRLGVDDLIERFRRSEAPLASNDIQDEGVQGAPEHGLRKHSLPPAAVSPATPSPPTLSPPTLPSLPMSTVVEVDGVETTISLESEDAGCAIEDQLLELELALTQMIQTESVKTDLLLFVNGIERLPPYHPSLLELFRDRESVWVNEASRKTRACPVDFFCFLDEEEKVEVVDCEMAMEVGTIKEEAPIWVVIDEEAADSSSALVEQEEKQAENVNRVEMGVEVEILEDEQPVRVLPDDGAAGSAAVLEEPALPTVATEGEEEMADAEPATSVDESGAGAILAIRTSDPLQTEELLPSATAEEDEEMAGVEPTAFIDESGVEAILAMLAAEPVQIEESLPAMSVDESGAGAILTMLATEPLQAEKPLPAATAQGDDEMTGVKPAASVDEFGAEAMWTMPATGILSIEESTSGEAKTEDVEAGTIDVPTVDEPSTDGFIQAVTSGEFVVEDEGDSEMAGAEHPSVIEGADDMEMEGTEPSPDGEAALGKLVTKNMLDLEMAGPESLPVQTSQIGFGTEPSASC